MLIAVAFVLMGVMFIAGMYVAGALGSLALILLQVFSDNPVWNIMGNRAWETNTNVNLVAIPLFILMGEIVLRGGFADLMYRALSRWVDFIPGGLMHTNIASCAVFAACAGSSIATAATVSRVALPSFRAQGYQERLVVGSLAAGGTLGILIPPSILLVLYGLTVGESIGRLFLAGFIPGILLAGVFMLMIGIASVIWPAVAPRRSGARFWSWEGWVERLMFTVLMVPVLALVFIVLGSIYFGWTTPSEAAGFGVTGALALAIIYNFVRLFAGNIAAFVLNLGIAAQLSPEVRGTLESWREEYQFSGEHFRNYCRFIVAMTMEACVSAARSSAMILFILMAAFTLQFAFAYLRISVTMAEWVASFNLSTVQLVLFLVVFYLLLGTFMEAYSMMLTTLPIISPVLRAAEVDLLWFGIIMIILLEAAQISPPQGLSLYVLQGARHDVARQEVADTGQAVETGTINDVYIGVLPFMACMAIVIGLIIVFPDLALWLPDQIKGPR
ncbi:MAG: TRAP transporter large permease subunit [Chloroflexi bacterium]|nr:TRAP transporter large permease subunit [Chloroflexota bacterium]